MSDSFEVSKATALCAFRNDSRISNEQFCEVAGQIDDEIERLQGETTFLAGQLREDDKQEIALRERIDELEKAYDKLLKDGWMEWKKAGSPGDWSGHRITTEQIRAAWDLMYNHDMSVRAFEELGIVRCDHLKASQINGELVEPCPDCNGEGWVKE